MDRTSAIRTATAKEGEGQVMTNEERRKAAEWFRNRTKNCQMPGARRMYEIATEALEDMPPAERARFWIDSEGKISTLPSGKFATDINVGDTIYRKQAIDIVRNRVKRFTTACVLAVTEIEQLPPAQPDDRIKKIADLLEGTIDNFDRDDAMDLLYQVKEALR